MLKRIALPLFLAVLMVGIAFVTLPQEVVQAKPDQGISVVTTSITGTTTVYPGGSYIMTATGFTPLRTVEILAGDVRVAIGKADATGQYTDTVGLPLVGLPVSGVVTFTAQNADESIVTTYAATLMPKLSLNAASFSVGSPIKIQGYAFGASEAFTATMVDAYDVAQPNCIGASATVSETLITGTTTALGTFNGTGSIPNVGAGTYYVVAIGENSATCAVE